MKSLARWVQKRQPESQPQQKQRRPVSCPQPLCRNPSPASIASGRPPSRRVLIAQVTVLLKSFVNDSFEINRDLHIQPHRSGWRLVQYRVKDVARSFAAEENQSRCHLIQHCPKRKQVSPRIQFLAAYLLGRHGAEAVLHSLSDSAPAKPRSIGRLGTTACLHNSAWA